MKVICDVDALTQVAIEKGLGVMDLARTTGISFGAATRLFQGKPVLIKTANKIYQALGKDSRLKIWRGETNG